MTTYNRSPYIQEYIQDFSGGLDTLNAPNRLIPNRSPTHQNVWYDDGALQKRPGQLKISTGGTGDQILGRSWFGQSMHTSVFSASQVLFMNVNPQIGKAIITNLPAASLSLAPNLMNTGGTGTVTTSSASPTVTGAGTNFTTAGIAAVGGIFSVGTTVGIIQSVDSATQITLTANFGANNAGASYVIQAGFPTANRVGYADMNNSLWVCSQGGTPVQCTSTSTQTFIPAFPQAYYNLSYSNYMFAANTASNPSRVSWSALADPTTWPASNFVDVNPNDGFPIVGMFNDGQSIVILKTNTAWKLTGQTFDPANPTYSLTQMYVPSDFVINSPKSIQLYSQYGFIMLGQNGLYLYNGSGVISKLLDYDRIRSEFSLMQAFNVGVVPSITAEPSAIVVNGNYWLQVSDNNVDNQSKEATYILDRQANVWKWIAVRNGVISDFTYINGVLYGVNSNTGGTPGLIQLNTGSSDAQSTAINGTFNTKILEFSDSQRFGRANVYFKAQSAGNLTFGYSVNEGSFTTVSVDMTTATYPTSGYSNRIKSSDIMIGQVGRTIQFQFSNNTAGQTFEVYGVSFERSNLEN